LLRQSIEIWKGSKKEGWVYGLYLGNNCCGIIKPRERIRAAARGEFVIFGLYQKTLKQEDKMKGLINKNRAGFCGLF
jgi:hypothetical protein